MLSWVGLEVSGIGEAVAPFEAVPLHSLNYAAPARRETLGAATPSRNSCDVYCEPGFVK
jgi:hypothetical protein